MANNNKKYVSLTRLSNFLDNIKARYALIGHKHTTKDITDYVVDSELNPNSSNPVQNKVLDAEFDAISQAMQVLDAAIDDKADSTHDHNSAYYQKNEIDQKLSNKSDKTHNHDSDYADIDHNHDGVYSLADHNHDTRYDVKYEPKGTASSVVSTHNTSTSAHADIRDLITGLTTRLNTLANSDDTTLDQLSEIVTYIKNNKSLIDGVTTSKVNVADIINNLTTNIANKPLSAAQGVVIQKLINDLQAELDSHKHTVSEISDLTATATELNYMDGVTSNVQLQLDEIRSNIVQSDWNQSDSTKLDYVKNKTHYMSIEPTTLVDETANCTMGSHTFSAYFNIEIGENYTVIFDGTTYECTGFSDGGLPTIGAPYNKYTDYPFNIYTYKNKLYAITQEYGFYDIQIIGNAQVFHTIDERYLPDTLAKVDDLEKIESSLSNKVNISSINGVELEHSATVEDHGWNEMAYGNGKYVVVGGQSFMYSTDGKNWTMGTLPNSAQGIVYGNGVFCTYGYSGTTVCYSADGINWNTADTNYNSNKFGIVFLNGRFYISAGTAILHSANCVSWSTISLGKNIALSDGAYGNGTYVMCGDGYAVVSTNGTSWTTVTMPTNDHYDSVCFANGRFVAFAHYTVNFGATNKIAYSIDGVNWTTGTLPISAKWVGAKYANGMFVVAGFTGMVYSADGDNWEVGSLLDGWSTVGCIGFGKELLFINEGQIVFGKINPYGLSFKKDQRWNLIYDSGEISAIANSISNINVSGYTNIQVLVRCYNDGDSIGSRAGSAIFTCANGKTYQFPVWSSMFSKSINTVYTMATFNLVDGWLICPYASRLIGDATTFDDEGGTAGNLALTGSGMMKCTSQLSTLTISSLDQNSNHYFGMGSRVMVWGWNA